MVDPQVIPGQCDHTLDIALLMIVGIQEDHNIAALNPTYAISQLVDE